MKKVGTMLRNRIEDNRLAMEAEVQRIEREKIFKALQHQKELELAEALRISKLKETKRQFEELLIGVMNVWKKSLNRSHHSSLYLSEIISTYQYVCELPAINTFSEIYEIVKLIIKVLTIPGSQLPIPTPKNEIFDKKDSFYEIDFSTIDKWDEEFFVKASLRLMIDWDVSQLSTFIDILSTEVQKQRKSIDKIFLEEFYLPKFPSLSGKIDNDQWF